MVQVPRRGREAKGQGLAEYAMILSLITLIAVVALMLIGTTVSSLIPNLTNYM